MLGTRDRRRHQLSFYSFLSYGQCLARGLLFDFGFPNYVLPFILLHMFQLSNGGGGLGFTPFVLPFAVMDLFFFYVIIAMSYYSHYLHFILRLQKELMSLMVSYLFSVLFVCFAFF